MFGMLAKKRAPEILDIRVHGVEQQSSGRDARVRYPTLSNVSTAITLGSFWGGRGGTASQGRRHVGPAFSLGRADAHRWRGPRRDRAERSCTLGWFLLLPYALVNLAYWTPRGSRSQASGKTPGAWHGDIGSGTVPRLRVGAYADRRDRVLLGRDRSGRGAVLPRQRCRS